MKTAMRRSLSTVLRPLLLLGRLRRGRLLLHVLTLCRFKCADKIKVRDIVIVVVVGKAPAATIALIASAAATNHLALLRTSKGMGGLLRLLWCLRLLWLMGSITLLVAIP